MKTIGKELTIFSHSVKQKGYGRQALYLEFLEIPGKHYFADVYPNVLEYYNILLADNASYNEEGEYHTDANGNGKHFKVYSTVTEALNDVLKGREIEVGEDER